MLRSMKRVSVTNFDDVSLLQQLRNIYKIFKGNGMDERLLFDMQSTTWVVPLLVLPIATYETQKVNMSCREIKMSEVIDFPDGISPSNKLKTEVEVHTSRSAFFTNTTKRGRIYSRRLMEELFG